jgi:pyruvate/2-oxoglutarate dehydrogenase complex dihydrolipoamide acyltransferase (E2) component
MIRIGLILAMLGVLTGAYVVWLISSRRQKRKQSQPLTNSPEEVPTPPAATTPAPAPAAPPSPQSARQAVQLRTADLFTTIFGDLNEDLLESLDFGALNQTRRTLRQAVRQAAREGQVPGMYSVTIQTTQAPTPTPAPAAAPLPSTPKPTEPKANLFDHLLEDEPTSKCEPIQAGNSSSTEKPNDSQ